jgi:hypothetical protein
VEEFEAVRCFAKWHDLATTLAPGVAVGVRRRLGLAIVEEVEAVRCFAKWHDLAITLAPGMAVGVRRRVGLAAVAEFEAVRFLAKWHDLATTLAPGMAVGVRRRVGLATVAEVEAVRCLAKWHDLATTLAPCMAVGARRRFELAKPPGAPTAGVTRCPLRNMRVRLSRDAPSVQRLANHPRRPERSPSDVGGGSKLASGCGMEGPAVVGCIGLLAGGCTARATVCRRSREDDPSLNAVKNSFDSRPSAPIVALREKAEDLVAPVAEARLLGHPEA